MIDVLVKRLTKTAKMPTKAHATDACFDIYADLGIDKIEIKPHTTKKIKTGLAMAIPEGYYAPIYARSGVATKRFLRLAQGTAIIDCDYRGEWLIPIHNDGEQVEIVENGERICQFDIQKVYPTQLIEVDELNSTDRGTGGFGSSGNK